MVLQQIKYTDEGVTVYVQSEILIDSLPNKILEIEFDVGVFRSAIKAELESIGIHTIISHEPIITAEDQYLIDQGKPLKAIVLEQRLLDGNEFYIDGFGFYVYLRHSFITGIDSIDDTRFEKIKPPDL